MSRKGLHRMAVLGLVLLFAGGGQMAVAQNSPKVYPRLVAALTKGKDVSVTVDFAQCTAAGHNGPDAIGGLHINGYLIPQHKYVAFSDVHDTLTPQNQKVTEYVRYRVAPDDSVSVRTTSLAADGKVVLDVEYRCAIGKGAGFTWRDH